MNSLCLFSSYFESGEIPYYIRFYLLELKKHCTKLVFITNEKVLPDTSRLFLQDHGIDCLLVLNEGYDFGMWSKGLDEYPPGTYDTLLLINDSCILLRNLDAVFEQIGRREFDYCGLLDSKELSYHIQSYFLAFSGPAIPVLQTYLKSQGIQLGMKEVVYRYEVGLAKYLIGQGLRVGALYPRFDSGKGDVNAAYVGITELIAAGFPLIKKKLLFDSFSLAERKNLLRKHVKTGYRYYLKFIAQTVRVPDAVDLSLLKEDQKRYSSPKSRKFLDSLFIFAYGVLRALAGRK